MVYRPVRTLDAFVRLEALQSGRYQACESVKTAAEGVLAVDHGGKNRLASHRRLRITIAERSNTARRAVAATTIGALSVTMLVMDPVAALPGSPAVQHHSTVAAPTITGLGQGSRGDAVRALQQALIGAGITVVGGADGIFGPQTQASIERFQTQRGLPVTGVVDDATASALSTSSSSTGGNAGSGVGGDSGTYVGLSQGARGAEVEAVQRALRDKGVWLPRITGEFDSSTVRGVRQFQGWNKLGVTGTITEATARVLGLDGSAPAPTTPTTAPPPSPSTPTTPPSAEASNKYVGLAVGARGNVVKEVQQALINAGVTVRGGADGVFGPATKAALSSYQQSQGLTASGVVNKSTAERLGLGTSKGPQPYAPGSNPTPDTGPQDTGSGNSYVGLKRGDTGSLVTELQKALKRFGLVTDAEGQFKAQTERALKAFQSVNGIPQTGVVTERGAQLLALGTTGSGDNSGGSSTPAFQMERFPVQGLCFFGDTWHAPRGGGRLHVGTDIIAAEGKLLYAVVDGTISKMYWDQPGALSGNGVRVAQDDGTYFTYLHMQGFAPGIEVGTKVKAGDVIGWVGNTGSSATPHLHFEIHPGGGAAINPYPYLKAMDDCKNTTPQYQSSFSPSE